MCMTILPPCAIYKYSGCRGQERALDPSGTRVHGFELSYGCWEVNLGPLKHLVTSPAPSTLLVMNSLSFLSFVLAVLLCLASPWFINHVLNFHVFTQPQLLLGAEVASPYLLLTSRNASPHRQRRFSSLSLFSDPIGHAEFRTQSKYDD